MFKRQKKTCWKKDKRYQNGNIEKGMKVAICFSLRFIFGSRNKQVHPLPRLILFFVLLCFFCCFFLSFYVLLVFVY